MGGVLHTDGGKDNCSVQTSWSLPSWYWGNLVPLICKVRPGSVRPRFQGGLWYESTLCGTQDRDWRWHPCDVVALEAALSGGALRVSFQRCAQHIQWGEPDWYDVGGLAQISQSCTVQIKMLPPLVNPGDLGYGVGTSHFLYREYVVT